jgi:uncharacterized protein YndB with AHSA1/START domain
VQPQSLLETLENFYTVFADTLQQMQYNTTCTCRACKNMHVLDLKMCIHFGEYLIQKLADREELLGADVIVPHRMLKNEVLEKTGVKAYALFSEAAGQALTISEYCNDLQPYNQNFEHIGDVQMHVHDLRPVWEQEKTRRRNFVDREDAWVKYEVDLPYPPVLIWEYLTAPHLEAGFLGFDYAERTDQLGGRVRETAEFHCAHGELHIHGQILDWKPFEYYTLKQSVMGLNYVATRRLAPLQHGTRVGVYLSPPAENSDGEVRQMLQASIETGFNGLGPFIEKDIAKGTVTTVTAA